MNLTIEITDADLDEIKQQLRVDSLHYSWVVANRCPDNANHAAFQYAKQILAARNALGLSNDGASAIYTD